MNNMERRSFILDKRSIRILLILVIIELIINGIAAAFNRATTFCLADVMIVESSRLIQLISILLCLIKTGILIWGNQHILQKLLSGISILVQIGLIISIFLIDESCLWFFFSAWLAIGCCILTICLSAMQIFYNVYFTQKNRGKPDETIPN